MNAGIIQSLQQGDSQHEHVLICKEPQAARVSSLALYTAINQRHPSARKLNCVHVYYSTACNYSNLAVVKLKHRLLTLVISTLKLTEALAS